MTLSSTRRKSPQQSSKFLESSNSRSSSLLKLTLLKSQGLLIKEKDALHQRSKGSKSPNSARAAFRGGQTLFPFPAPIKYALYVLTSRNESMLSPIWNSGRLSPAPPASSKLMSFQSIWGHQQLILMLLAHSIKRDLQMKHPRCWGSFTRRSSTSWNAGLVPRPLRCSLRPGSVSTALFSCASIAGTSTRVMQGSNTTPLSCTKTSIKRSRGLKTISVCSIESNLSCSVLSAITPYASFVLTMRNSTSAMRKDRFLKCYRRQSKNGNNSENQPNVTTPPGSNNL